MGLMIEGRVEVEVQVGRAARAAPAPSDNAAGSSAEHAGRDAPEDEDEEEEQQPMDLDADDEAGDEETAEVGRKAGMPGDEEVLGAEAKPTPAAGRPPPAAAMALVPYTSLSRKHRQAKLTATPTAAGVI